MAVETVSEKLMFNDAEILHLVCLYKSQKLRYRARFCANYWYRVLLNWG